MALVVGCEHLSVFRDGVRAMRRSLAASGVLDGLASRGVEKWGVFYVSRASIASRAGCVASREDMRPALPHRLASVFFL